MPGLRLGEALPGIWGERGCDGNQGARSEGIAHGHLSGFRRRKEREICKPDAKELCLTNEGTQSPLSGKRDGSRRCSDSTPIYTHLVAERLREGGTNSFKPKKTDRDAE